MPPAGWAENRVSGRKVLDRRCEAIELTVGGVVFAKVQFGRGSYGRVVGGQGVVEGQWFVEVGRDVEWGGAEGNVIFFFFQPIKNGKYAPSMAFPFSWKQLSLWTFGITL